MYNCETCKAEGKEFKTPVDEVGISLMQQHLQSEHGYSIPQKRVSRYEREYEERLNKLWWKQEEQYIYGYGN